MNRNTNKLGKKEYFINSFNSYDLVVELDIKADVELIEGSDNIGYFYARLKIDDFKIKRIPITINLLQLICRINQG